MIMRKLLFTLAASMLLLAVSSPKANAQSIVYGKNSRLKKETMAVPYFQDKPQASLTGWDFMLKADKMGFWKLEDAIAEAVLEGNIPQELRSFRKIVFRTPVVDSVEILRKPHKVEIWVLPDYISIGTSDNFVRMPMGPLAAQRIADSLNCILPTTFLVDRIAEVSQGHLNIFPFRPLGSRNSQPIVYQDSNNAINALYDAKGYKFGQFISGLKKDVVLTYKILTLPGNENRVAIYGWHLPNGKAKQPLHIKHGNFYADYSHGIRMIYRTIKVDGKEYDAREVLESPQLYRLLSNEPMYLKKASYEGLPRYE
jgi:hypothetical protein